MSTVCLNCNSAGTMTAVSRDITEKRRVKFGLFWVVATVMTGGLALLAWLVMPRKTVVVGVDRYTECSHCGAVA